MWKISWIRVSGGQGKAISRSARTCNFLVNCAEGSEYDVHYGAATVHRCRPASTSRDAALARAPFLPADPRASWLGSYPSGGVPSSSVLSPTGGLWRNAASFPSSMRLPSQQDALGLDQGTSFNGDFDLCATTAPLTDFLPADFGLDASSALSTQRQQHTLYVDPTLLVPPIFAPAPVRALTRMQTQARLDAFLQDAVGEHDTVEANAPAFTPRACPPSRRSLRVATAKKSCQSPGPITPLAPRPYLETAAYRSTCGSTSSASNSGASPSPSLSRSSSSVEGAVRQYTRRNKQVAGPVMCPDEGSTVCPMCSKKSSRLHDVARHMETHKGKIEGMCGGVSWEEALCLGVDITKGPTLVDEGLAYYGGCKKVFSRADALQRHLKYTKDGCVGSVGTPYNLSLRKTCRRQRLRCR
ncbi:hypothetical protein BKA93DRAFT_333443 [Sparassis latifolia]